MRRRIIFFTWLLCCATIPVGTAEAADLILRPQAQAEPEVICARYGFTLTSRLDTQHLFLVSAPDPVTQATLDSILATDKDVASLELSPALQAPSIAGEAALTQSIAGILETYATSWVNYYGGTAWDSYTTQSAVQQTHLNDAHALATGAGTIAIIDTGVDPSHPALANVLVSGYDFTRDIEGDASEWSDLPVLTQSIAGILETYAADVQAGQTPPVPLPEFFGHGTMVAGLVHLSAPTAKIMPLKAFNADGSTNLYDIIRAIYYAADHGARVLNMSFITWTPSHELQNALSYASRKGVFNISAIGNNGISTDTYPVYPAEYRVAYGIASVKGNKRSAFSNYGGDVTVGAPGEALLTTYPGGLYAAVWGTSFSTPLVSGGIGLMLQRDGVLTTRDLDTAIWNGSTRLKGEGLGAGRIDFYKALLTVPIK